MTEIAYNKTNKLRSAISYLLVRLMPHAKRSKKNTFFLLRKKYNPLWWTVFNSLILLKLLTSRIAKITNFCRHGLFDRADIIRVLLIDIARLEIVPTIFYKIC